MQFFTGWASTDWDSPSDLGWINLSRAAVHGECSIVHWGCSDWNILAKLWPSCIREKLAAGTHTLVLSSEMVCFCVYMRVLM